MIGRLRPASDDTTSAYWPATLRGTDHPIAARTLAALLGIGGLMGSVNLFVPGVLVEGPKEWIYAATMAFCVLAAVPLVVRGRVSPRHTFGLVLLGDLIYLVVVYCTVDPVRYATPLMLLFPVFVAAWFLGTWEVGVNMVVTTAVCLAALWPSYDDPVSLGVQAGISAGTLNACAAGVFILRRRIERLLTETQTLSHLDPLTGLFNRRYLVEQAPRMWRQARRDRRRRPPGLLAAPHARARDPRLVQRRRRLRHGGHERGGGGPPGRDARSPDRPVQPQGAAPALRRAAPAG